jgi:hypothetical protein
MKKITTVIFIILCALICHSQTAIAPEGYGTQSSPYKIATWENLYWLSENEEQWDKHFEQTANIEFPTDIEDWNEGKGWSPIGYRNLDNNQEMPFTGVYTGEKYFIKNLYINRPEEDDIGLFGILRSATIHNVNLYEVNITGGYNVGALSALYQCDITDWDYIHEDDPIIFNCSSSGVVKGISAVGGLFGLVLTSQVSNSYSNCEVFGKERVGGFAGNINGRIYKCYASGNVQGNYSVGGFAGSSSHIVQNCYSTGNVTCLKEEGELQSGAAFINDPGGQNAIIKNCYAIGRVEYNDAENPTDKGFVGESYNTPEFIDNYFSPQLSGQATAIGATAKTEQELKSESTFAAWDLHIHWTLKSHINNGFPSLKEDIVLIGEGSEIDPYLIRNWEELYWLAHNELYWFNKHFKQTADIEFPETIIYWNNGEGFKPIGREFSEYESYLFDRCTYDGNFYSIKNLYINKSGDNIYNDYNIGLFGIVERSTIKNLGIVDANITGHGNVGALVGQGTDDNNIINCYTSGNIELNSDYSNFAGGLIGNDEISNIINSYSLCSVSGGSMIGVFVGYAAGTNFENCYAAGMVEEGSYSGGFYGYYSGPTFTNCFWDMTTSQQNDDYPYEGISGKTTEQLKDIETFIDWNFEQVWQIRTDEYPTHIIPLRPNGSGTVSDPYIISTWEDLKSISETPLLWTSHFKQIADIELPSEIETWNNGKGWNPIGSNPENPFKGNYDGAGFTISNLYINRPEDDYVGLFGFAEAATISYLGLIEADVKGQNGVGGLLGYSFRSTIEQCYSNGKVDGNNGIGGLVGAASIMQSGQTWKSNIENSYSFATVNGVAMVGGFIGSAGMLNIKNCYSVGTVTGDSNVGGFMGAVPSFGVTATACYFDSEKSGQTDSERGIDKTTEEMLNQSTYTNWSFSNVWSINPSINQGYPYLDNHVMLNIEIEGEGVVLINSIERLGSFSYLKNTQIEIEAISGIGWSFENWSNDLVSEYEYERITLNESNTIQANFTKNPVPQYTLTLVIEGNGIVNVDGVSYTQTISLDEGSELTLEAIADDGWLFDGWSGNISSTELNTSIIMDGNKSIIATFAEEITTQYSLTINIIGNGTVMLNGVPYTQVIDVNEGTVIDIEAISENNWEFNGWSGDLSSNNESASITMNGNKTITATFTDISVTYYNFNIRITGNGAVKVGIHDYTEAIPVPEGSTLTLEAIADDGWAFSGWSGDVTSTGTTATTITIDEDKTVYVAFVEESPTRYILEFNVSYRTNPIQGASISIHNQTITTNSIGKASIELPNGTYSYTININQYQSFSGEVSINGQNVDETVNLIRSSTNLNDYKETEPYIIFDNALILNNISDVANITLVNMNGQQILNIPNNGNDELSISTINIERGVYMITFKYFDGKSITRKIIKK